MCKYWKFYKQKIHLSILKLLNPQFLKMKSYGAHF